MARSQKNHPLTRVSVLTTREAEDAVSEVLARIFAVPVSSYTDAETQVCRASVYLDGTPLLASHKRTIARELAALKEFGLPLGPAKVEASRIRREDWAESWKRHFKPIEIGASLLIKPSWIRQRPKKGQAVVILDPGLSFGTGQHATTSFCLRQLVASRRPALAQSFLDIGTGSGILAIAAAKLGYSPVEAFDFDPESVRVARANAAENDVGKNIKLRRQDLTKLPARGEPFDVVCANLIFDLLLQEQRRIMNRVKPGGQLILAGILATQFERVRRAYTSAELRLVAQQEEREWHSGAFVKA